ncbi:hypothetical protein L0222_30110 [bacterium]|nr:hypothetical protein [bacterium]
MSEDTGIGGSRSRFPTTRHSAILAARSGDCAERSRLRQLTVTDEEFAREAKLLLGIRV